jgi:ferrous iron transport protein A
LRPLTGLLNAQLPVSFAEGLVCGIKLWLVMPTRPHGETASVYKLTLDNLKPGERARVHTCVGEGTTFQRLCEMGFVEGAPLRVVRYAPMGDPMEVELHDYLLSLRKSEARMVQVELLSV